VGVKRRFGKLIKFKGPGTYAYNPFFTSFIVLPVRTIDVDITMDLPSKEGLIIQAQLSFLYHIKADSAMSILTHLGVNYQESVVNTAFRSSARDVSSLFFAKDMHTTERLNIEGTILKHMNEFLEPRGFVVEQVLLESITLPQGLSHSIEAKLEAEQQAQQMEFVLNKEKKEAERKTIEAGGIRDAMRVKAEGTRDMTRIEAEGIRDATRLKAEGTRDALRIEAEGSRDAQILVSQSLTPNVLKYLGIQAAKDLSLSNNAKTVITDGKNPMILGSGGN
jgi:regulator of protease activity HflC (stomatin/prohibitin superfamily)